MKKLIFAIILVLTGVNQSFSVSPAKIEPLPKVIFEPVIVRPSAGERPVPKIVQPTPITVEVERKQSSTKLTGEATWYCHGASRCTIGYPGGYYAAIRKDLLELRGSKVLVCAKKCVVVKIIDCNCGKHANLIDLYWDAFNAISDPSLGRIKVTVSW